MYIDESWRAFSLFGAHFVVADGPVHEQHAKVNRIKVRHDLRQARAQRCEKKKVEEWQKQRLRPSDAAAAADVCCVFTELKPVRRHQLRPMHQSPV